MKMNKLAMLALCGAFALTGCKDKTETTNTADTQEVEARKTKMFSGDKSRTWKAKREYDESGDKDKITREEKDERMTFYSNGTFDMTSDENSESGTWTYDGSSKRVKLIFDDNSDVAETFQVTDISDNKMTLIAGDGSKMILKED